MQSSLYGQCAADLLTFVNPMSRGTLLPDIPLSDHRYDGFAYQGGGVLLLALAVIVALACMRAARPPWSSWRRALPLVVVCVLEAIFALSSKVTFGGSTVISVDPAVVGRYLGVFQGTGRFVWPLFYLCLAGAIVLTIRLLATRPVWAYGVLSLTLAIQLFDQRNTVSTVETAVKYEVKIPLLTDDGWHVAEGGYRKLIAYPPGLRGCLGSYGGSFTQQQVYAFGFLALRIGTTTNSAFASRSDRRERAYCDDLTASLRARAYDPEAIYVVRADSRPLFADAACGQLDGYTVCVSPNRHDDFRALLDARRL
jgi:hypothetical protein